MLLQVVSTLLTSIGTRPADRIALTAFVAVRPTTFGTATVTAVAACSASQATRASCSLPARFGWKLSVWTGLDRLKGLVGTASFISGWAVHSSWPVNASYDPVAYHTFL